jgi:hypothetical protein
MSFRIALVAPTGAAAPAYAEFDSALEAFAAYRRWLRSHVDVQEVIDLRARRPRQIGAADLEAIAWCERREAYRMRDLWPNVERGGRA